MSKLEEGGYPLMPRLVISAQDLADDVEDLPQLCYDWADSLQKAESTRLQRQVQAAQQEAASAQPPRFISPFASVPRASSIDPGRLFVYCMSDL